MAALAAEPKLGSVLGATAWTGLGGRASGRTGWRSRGGLRRPALRPDVERGGHRRLHRLLLVGPNGRCRRLVLRRHPLGVGVQIPAARAAEPAMLRVALAADTADHVHRDHRLDAVRDRGSLASSTLELHSGDLPGEERCHPATATAMICGNCGADNAPGTSFCVNCGIYLSAKT